MSLAGPKLAKLIRRAAANNVVVAARDRVTPPDDIAAQHQTCISPSSGVKTARLRCDIVPFTRRPRMGGAYDSHHRTAGIAGCTRRRDRCVAARGAGAEDILNRVA